MKIAISAESDRITGAVDTRFGRAKGFIIHDTDTGGNTHIDNEQNLESAQGAGIQSAKAVINAGAKVLLTGNVGPKAYAVLLRLVSMCISGLRSSGGCPEDFKRKARKADTTSKVTGSECHLSKQGGAW